MDIVISLLSLLALAGAMWIAYSRWRRRLLLREALWQLRVARQLGRQGHFEPAQRYAQAVLDDALRGRDELREALAHEALGDIAHRAGGVRQAVHHWRLAAMTLQAGGHAADAGRVARKVGMALQQVDAPGVRRWQWRSALWELQGMDEDGLCGSRSVRFGEV